MEHLSRKELTLLALAFARGRPLTRIHLQKSVLMLQEVLSQEFGLTLEESYEFKHHLYGGYAPTVYEDAVDLGVEQLVETDDPPPGENYPYNYNANEEGIDQGIRVLEKMPLGFGSRGRGLVEWVSSFNSAVALAQAVYDLFPEYEENSVVPRPPREWGYVRRRIETIKPAPINSPVLNNIRWIQAVTGFSAAEVSSLLSVTQVTLEMWFQGLKVPEFETRHTSLIYDVLKAAERLHPTQNSMRVWLNSRQSGDMETPTEMLTNREYDKVRYRAVATPPPGGRLLSRSPLERSDVDGSLSRSSELRDDWLTPDSEIGMADLFDMPSNGRHD